MSDTVGEWLAGDTVGAAVVGDAEGLGARDAGGERDGAAMGLAVVGAEEAGDTRSP